MKMTCNEAFDAWLSLFNENAANAWAAERKELRKAAMLLSVLDLELRGIQKTVSDEFYMWQKRLNSLESLKRCSEASPPSRKGILQEQKENRTPDHNDVFAGIMPLHDLSNQNQILLNSDVFLIKSSPDESGIELEKHASNSPEREQTVIKETCISPKINKTWKYSRLKRPRDITNTNSYSLLDITKTPKSTSGMVVDNDFTATPDKEVIEATIIDVTPEPPQEAKKLKHSKLGNLLNQKRKAKGQKANKVASNSILTQMFSNVVASTKNEESLKKAEFDDLTYCPIINVESCDKYGEQKPDSNLDDPPKKDNDDSDLTYCPTNDINLTTAKNSNKEQPAILVTEACKFQDEGNPDSTKKQGSKTPRKSNVPFKFKMKPVRGKERLKLEGWNCEECRRFYEGMGKNFAAAKDMMNKCSRHRNMFKPDDYTAPGFWDLNFTPTQHLEDKSTIFNL